VIMESSEGYAEQLLDFLAGEGFHHQLPWFYLEVKPRAFFG